MLRLLVVCIWTLAPLWVNKRCSTEKKKHEKWDFFPLVTIFRNSGLLWNLSVKLTELLTRPRCCAVANSSEQQVWEPGTLQSPEPCGNPTAAGSSSSGSLVSINTQLFSSAEPGSRPLWPLLLQQSEESSLPQRICCLFHSSEPRLMRLCSAVVSSVKGKNDGSEILPRDQPLNRQQNQVKLAPTEYLQTSGSQI